MASAGTKRAPKPRNRTSSDDFIAASEHLIQRASPRRTALAINGGSNGGLLVAAVMQQRPELFDERPVGVLDMLRYHLFTVGKRWASDYGTVDDKAEFEALLRYSPVHNAKAGVRYPT